MQFAHDFGGTVVGPCEGFPGYTVIDFDRQGMTVIPSALFGTRIFPEGSQCDWCWKQVGNVWYEVLGSRFCDTDCHDQYRRLLKRSLERRFTDTPQ